MSESLPVAVTGMSIMTALGRGPSAQLSGTPAFAEVTRFDTSNRRTHHAAIAADAGTLEEELDQAIAEACAQAGVDRNTTPLLLALHEPPTRDFGQLRTYTSACVSATTALADAATLIRLGRLDRVVVAAAYLVEPYQYALFDTGRALSTDGAVRPFSLNRTGTLLGDGVAAVVLQPGEGLAQLLACSRTGDAHHPVQPAPNGQGLTTAIQSALHKAGLAPADIGYVNANATGTTYADAAESAALTRAFDGLTHRSEGSTPGARGGDPQRDGLTHQAGPEGAVRALAGRAGWGGPAVSSTKGVHGHALEASGLVEFVVTVAALRSGKLPVNAGFLEADPPCGVDLILDAPRLVSSPYAMSLNSAFGGANTALVVRVG
ncbi:3-oxoacyl-(acyl-carrier-protein) synthase [Kribbella rubisoli]|uniref:3-oxoacyl-(Acyl-carrier-protein) synthase n=1 Tax=Kribbella rubisoli TaxID=3075929 RepID=A0A4Q7X9V1_9ACTN|nr:beta-ketoacyl synthase N-terminal-like domain-containing protein [Kribbella rubisoli]RZU19485.1 3-oxoacyl-(acyl-carrier-protein) synthase [Kribbella rubisoli]